VLDWDPAPPPPRKGHSSPPLSAHAYCGHGRPSQLLLSSCFFHFRQHILNNCPQQSVAPRVELQQRQHLQTHVRRYGNNVLHGISCQSIKSASESDVTKRPCRVKASVRVLCSRRITLLRPRTIPQLPISES